MQRLRVDAPAKINLGLRVVGRRPDGYHELESVFAPLDLADRLELELDLEIDDGSAPGVELRVHGDQPVPPGEENLATRAASRFLAAAGLRASLRIELHKRIPVAAGLGGGSSDAGAVLRALSRLQPRALSDRELVDLALGLGADVPFFLDPRPARVGGVGERVEPLPVGSGGLPPLALLLANPGTRLSTRAVFEAFDALGDTDPPGLDRALQPLLAEATADWSPARLAGALEPLLFNGLEPAAVRLCPAIGRLRRRMEGLGALATGMSGSGATVYGVFASLAAAREARHRADFESPVWSREAATLESPPQSR